MKKNDLECMQEDLIHVYGVLKYIKERYPMPKGDHISEQFYKADFALGSLLSDVKAEIKVMEQAGITERRTPKQQEVKIIKNGIGTISIKSRNEIEKDLADRMESLATKSPQQRKGLRIR